MRLLHYKTIEIITNNELDYSKSTVTSKTILSHAWSEVFKHVKTRQKHPKMFFSNDHEYGSYLAYVYQNSLKTGNKFKLEVLEKYKVSHPNFYKGFIDYNIEGIGINANLLQYFDDLYLFSDCNSLYYKGLNVFPEVYGDKWRKYIPVESRAEILRQLNKTIDK